MDIAVMATSFAEFMKNEWLGLVASTIVLVSFLMTNQIKTRMINMVGCIAFVVYGLLLPSYSTAIMNGGVFIVHVVFLIKHFVKRRKEKNAVKEQTPTDGIAPSPREDGKQQSPQEGDSPHHDDER